jgi:predicted transposase/invertase (TIGR01784 family)
METTDIFFDEKDEILDICYDNVFKAVFTRDTPASQRALSRLISALICQYITVITISANEPAIDNIKDRQIHFDISCRAETGELINVEMCLNPDPFEPIRLEFYAGKLFTSQDIKGTGKDYDDLKQAYQIAILAKEQFFKDEEFSHSFEYYDPIRGVSLNGKSRIITLELSKSEKIVEKSTDEMNAQELWAVYFRYLTDISKRQKINKIIELEEGIAMASELLKNISKDEIERARLLSEYKYQLDLQSKLVHAKREGVKEGIQKEKQKIIDLLKSGKSPEEILKDYESE